MANDLAQLSELLPKIRLEKFSRIPEIRASASVFLDPPQGTVEEIASKFTRPILTMPGKYSQKNIAMSLSDAAFSLNRKIGQKWSDGAVALIAPHAAKNISHAYKLKIERIAATYMAIVLMPEAYDVFSAIYPIKGTIKRRDIVNARAEKKNCGLFPFC